jgi:hypothetical protein
MFLAAPIESHIFPQSRPSGISEKYNKKEGKKAS